MQEKPAAQTALGDLSLNMLHKLSGGLCCFMHNFLQIMKYSIKVDAKWRETSRAALMHLCMVSKSLELYWTDETQFFQKIFPHLVFFDQAMERAASHISPASLSYSSNHSVTCTIWMHLKWLCFSAHLLRFFFNSFYGVYGEVVLSHFLISVFEANDNIRQIAYMKKKDVKRFQAKCECWATSPPLL